MRYDGFNKNGTRHTGKVTYNEDGSVKAYNDYSGFKGSDHNDTIIENVKGEYKYGFRPSGMSKEEKKEFGEKLNNKWNK